MAFKIPSYLSRQSIRPYMAEFLGTALLVLIGCGVCAQAILSDFIYASFLSVNFSWAGAIVLSCYIFGGASVNPALSIATAIIRPSKQTFRELPGKLLAQFSGAFVGAALVYGMYASAIKAWDPEYTVPFGSILSPRGHHSAGIFGTYPAAHFENNWEPALTEFLGTATLMFGALCVGEEKNKSMSANRAFAMFCIMVCIGASFGWQTGYAVNPARDFGPRLFSSFIYGREVFSTKNFYFVVPLVAPVFGAIAAAFVYDAFLFEGEGSIVADTIEKFEDNDGSLRLD